MRVSKLFVAIVIALLVQTSVGAQVCMKVEELGQLIKSSCSAVEPPPGAADPGNAGVQIPHRETPKPASPVHEYFASALQAHFDERVWPFFQIPRSAEISSQLFGGPPGYFSAELADVVHHHPDAFGHQIAEAAKRQVITHCIESARGIRIEARVLSDGGAAYSLRAHNRLAQALIRALAGKWPVEFPRETLWDQKTLATLYADQQSARLTSLAPMSENPFEAILFELNVVRDLVAGGYSDLARLEPAAAKEFRRAAKLLATVAATTDSTADDGFASFLLSIFQGPTQQDPTHP